MLFVEGELNTSMSGTDHNELCVHATPKPLLWDKRGKASNKKRNPIGDEVINHPGLNPIRTSVDYNTRN